MVLIIKQIIMFSILCIKCMHQSMSLIIKQIYNVFTIVYLVYVLTRHDNKDYIYVFIMYIISFWTHQNTDVMIFLIPGSGIDM